jgi:hypothetical protein
VSVVASFHLHRFPTRHAARAAVGTVLDRRPLATTPGLRFARGMGTGRGADMGPGADLHRWALFAVWDDDAALDRFLATSTLSQRWSDRAVEAWMVRLLPLAATGAWGGADPLTGLDEDAARLAVAEGGPVAVLTRATIPARHWAAFHRAVPPVDRVLHRQEGLLATLGVGERPVGLQATFSLWRSADDVAAFAYRPGPHRDVIATARRQGWFREELFARFAPYASAGSWDGRDPLG